MYAVAQKPEAQAGRGLRAAYMLTGFVIVLAGIAAAVGVFWPDFYHRETAWVIPQNRGQDLITLLVAVPALAASLVVSMRGSARGSLVWIGTLGYVLYTYLAAAMTYRFNELFLVYVALFSLSVFALVSAGSGLPVAAIQRKFGPGTPRGPVVAFLGFLAFVLTLMWMGQIMPFFTAGKLPDLIIQAESATNFVYVLDLGLIVPLSALAAVWLWRREPWGYVLAGVVLIKALTMGLALLGMSYFSWLTGNAIDLVYVWIGLAVSSLGMSVWFFRHCRG